MLRARPSRQLSCQRDGDLSQLARAPRPSNAQVDIMRVGKFLLTLSAVTGVSFSIAQAQPVTIRHSYVVPVANWTPLLPVKKDLARHWGKSYVMEATRYEGTPPMITAL